MPRFWEALGFQQNCTHCVATVERQLNGDWLEAAPRPRLGRSTQDLIKSLPPARRYLYSSYSGLIAKMTQLGDGARGFVHISRPDGTAHVFNVLTTRDGVVFLDGQSGKLGTLEKNVTGIGLYVYRTP